MYFSKSLKLVLIGVLWLLLPKYTYAADNSYSKNTTHQQQKLPKVLLLDHYGSPYASASWIISTRLWLNELEDRYLMSQNASSAWLRRWVSAVYNNLTNDLLMVTAHEAFGHGFRHRSLGERVVRYQFNLLSFSWLLNASFFPLPGLSAFTEGEYLEELSTVDIRLLSVMGGSQANTVLASELIRTHFNSGILDHKTANLFFKSFTDLPLDFLRNYTTTPPARSGSWRRRG